MTIALLIVFFFGYLAIVLEQPLRVNKAASTLLTGVACWTVYATGCGDVSGAIGHLVDHIGEIAGILFFLMGALTIVELIDMHGGFAIVTSLIRMRDKRALLWVIGAVSFFLSSVLDNMTTAIVMVTLLGKLIDDRSDRLLLAGVVIIAVNAGGAWSPIGDVTTTMLWIDGKVTTLKLMSSLFLPGIVCAAAPLAVLSFVMRGRIAEPAAADTKPDRATGNLIFFTGVGALLFVPVFKALTGLPPYMGILLGLGVLWLLTELVHRRHEEDTRQQYTIAGALRRIDLRTILFFLGILLAVAALQTAGLLDTAARLLDAQVGNKTAIAFIIGIVSSVVDNVPLVAAGIGMYGGPAVPTDHPFWHMLAYCAGTGGSLLIIGSAAGVAVMGIAKIDFFWYVKRIAPLALLGYCAGMALYIAVSAAR